MNKSLVLAAAKMVVRIYTQFGETSSESGYGDMAQQGFLSSGFQNKLSKAGMSLHV